MLTSREAKDARGSLRLSQACAAEAVGINRTYLSLFEAGKYVLDEDTQAKLRAFYAREGYNFGAEEPKQHAAMDPVETASINRDDKSGQEGFRDGGRGTYVSMNLNPRARAAFTTLQTLQSTANETGAGSKRTAAATRAAREALEHLDYPELQALAKDTQTSLDLFPSESEFQWFELAEREMWEMRAASVLVCAALYGKHWSECRCDTWRDIGKALVEQRLMRDNDRPRRPLFGGAKADEEYARQSRARLAPALVRAAEQRRTLKLARHESTSRSAGWSFFDQP